MKKIGKYKNNNQGFTLIELLAVIVIIAILMTLAVPAINKIIASTRENLRLKTARRYIDASKQYFISEGATGNNEFDGKTNIISQIEMVGKQADSGSIIVDSDGKIKIALKIDGRCYKNNGMDVFYDGKSSYCDLFEDTTHDKTPGELDGKGTSKEPYKIESMEDLVRFANIVNNREYVIGNYSAFNFYINLSTNLDFKAEQSYVNPNTTEFGDVNKNGIVEPLIKELNTGYGFPMIDSNKDEKLKLFFDGKNHYIKNYGYNIINTDSSKTITLSLFGNYYGGFGRTHINNLTLKDIDFNIDTVGNANISGLIQQIGSYYSD